jgi:hypothetical protein
MRSVVYFPELRTPGAVVPAHVAIGVHATRLEPSVTASPEAALDSAPARLNSISMPRPSRRRSIVPASVIEI